MQKTVLITGGSGGLGFKISRYFALNNYHLLWVSIDNQELEEAKKRLINEFPEIKIDCLAVDLSIEGSSQQLFNWVKNNQIAIDVLINNAGFGSFGFFQDASFQREQSMIQLNILNLFNLTHLFLPEMIKRNKGTIINISSNSSFIPLPKMLTYSSTKAFVTHFSKGLREEMKMQKSKVRVITVCPAAIKDTHFKTAGNMEKLKTFEGLATTTSDEVARDVWKAFTGKRDFMVSGRKMRFLYFFYPIIPYRLLQMIARQELKIQSAQK